MSFGFFHAVALHCRGKAVGFIGCVVMASALGGCLGNNGTGGGVAGEPQSAAPPGASIATAGAAPPVSWQAAPATVAAPPAQATEVVLTKVARPASPVIANRQPTPLATPVAVVAAPQVATATPPKHFNPRPARKAERHVLKFYTKAVKVYDKPYGNVTAEMEAAQFPRERMASGGEGVPVYKDGASFIELAVASDGTGWVKIEDVAMSAKPCKVDPRPSPGSAGPIGAGSSSAACVR